MRVRKLCIYTFLILVMLFLFVLNINISTCFAEEFSGNAFKYEINNDGTIEITGMNVQSPNVNIPATIDGYSVKNIADCAFWGNHVLETLTIDAGVESIGILAFEECVNLSTVFLPDNIYICQDAFRNCESLKSITLLKGVQLQTHYVNDINVLTIFGYVDEPVMKGSDATTSKKIEEFIIYGYFDSSAETYANENGFTFIALDEQPTTTTTTESTTTITTTTITPTTTVTTDESKTDSTTVMTIATTDIVTTEETITVTTTITVETNTEQTTESPTTDAEDSVSTETSAVPPTTTTGTETTLPQTGYSKWYHAAAALAVCMTGIGGSMVIGSGVLKKKRR